MSGEEVEILLTEIKYVQQKEVHKKSRLLWSILNTWYQSVTLVEMLHSKNTRHLAIGYVTMVLTITRIFLEVSTSLSLIQSP